jgi:hypothetical protein
MKLSDTSLIQYARRLAQRLETEKSFLVGVDEQDFNPKIYVLNKDSYCVLSLTKRVDEQSLVVTYALGHISESSASYSVNTKESPLDEDLNYVLSIIEKKSLRIKTRRQDDEPGRDRKCSSR